MSVQVVTTLNRFGAFAASLDRTVESALDMGVKTCIAVADPLTPVDTGRLRGDKTITKGSGVRTITWNAEYAAYQEFGTSRGVPARHFARSGMDAALPVIEAGLKGWP